MLKRRAVGPGEPVLGEPPARLDLGEERLLAGHGEPGCRGARSSLLTGSLSGAADVWRSQIAF